jgi:SecD/SecF fusion protein
LNGGALPAPCLIKEQNRVGPSIGAENSNAGLVSFGFAFLAVLLYMFFYYGKSGLAANIALLANVIFIMGCLASFGAVLTLAGIAGIILTIGTAVDANILIFERIREEQRDGKEVNKAVEIGFQKALPSIIDANMTHLLVALILKYFGTGEIESFATTLIVGIFTSVFSAIFISRLVISYWMEKNKGVSFDTKYSKGLFQNFNFNWIGARKYFYIFSIAVTVIGMISLFSRGLKESVEFTGGRTLSVKFEKKADIEQIRKALEATFIENKEVSSIELKTVSNDYNVEVTTNYKLKDDGATEEVKTKLLTSLEVLETSLGKAKILGQRTVSASVSSELWNASFISMSVALLAIFLYILFRFGYWQYSVGAIVGLIHDAFFVISVFSLLHGYLPFSLDVNQAFIAAILTVIGYSMNDTVIVFDRIRENLRSTGENDHHYVIVNKSLNTTLSRTFNTSMILFMVVLIMFIFGGASIKGFLFALLVGVVIGTYSSLCVATPILIDFSKRLKA